MNPSQRSTTKHALTLLRRPDARAADRVRGKPPSRRRPRTMQEPALPRRCRTGEAPSPSGQNTPTRGSRSACGISSAKGDGATDDTAAVRAAVKAAFERRRIPQHPQYGYFVSFSEAVIPNSVTLESCYLYNSQDAAVVLKEIPNLLTIRNCTGLPWPSWAVRVDKKIDLDTYFDREGQKCGVSINMAGNVGAFGGLPQQLWPYNVNEIVARTPPAKGNWTRGQFIRNANQEGHWTAAGYVKAAKPAVAEPQGWLCTESGKPGTWQAIPYIGVAEKPAESATGKGEKTP